LQTDRQLQRQVIALSGEVLMRPHPHGEQQIASCPAARTALSLAAYPQAAAILGPGGDAHRDRLATHWRRQIEGSPHYRFGETDLDARAHVPATCRLRRRAGATGTTEQVAEQIANAPDATHAPTATATKEIGQIYVHPLPATPKPPEALGGARPLGIEAVLQADVTELVVQRAPLVVGEHLVGTGDLLETPLVGGTGVLVRMQRAGQLAVSLLDGALGGVTRNAQN